MKVALNIVSCDQGNLKDSKSTGTVGKVVTEERKDSTRIVHSFKAGASERKSRRPSLKCSGCPKNRRLRLSRNLTFQWWCLRNGRAIPLRARLRLLHR